jgi:hypothetical protein
MLVLVWPKHDQFFKVVEEDGEGEGEGDEEWDEEEGEEGDEEDGEWEDVDMDEVEEKRKIDYVARNFLLVRGRRQMRKKGLRSRPTYYFTPKPKRPKKK